MTVLWDEHFPPIYSHTSISFLKRCPGFLEAKNGNVSAAREVVRLCVKKLRLLQIKQNHPNAVLLPVTGNNKLPAALAAEIGLRVSGKIKIDEYSQRKRMTHAERLITKPVFYGNITKGEHYILVDDIIAQGGTISELRRYVINNGGFVDAAAALAHSASNGALAPKIKNLILLNEKFCRKRLEKILNNNLAGCLDELTDPQIKYLLRFKKLGSIEKKIQEC